MKKTDGPELAKLVYALGELYSSAISEIVLQLWFAALEKYDIGDISVAATRWVQNTEGGQFMPKPADIIRLIDGSAGTRATEAWNRAMSAMCTHGTNATVAFDDPGIHYAITEMGGWIEFGYWDNSETPFKQKRFEDLYRAYSAAPRGDAYVALEGRANATNRAAGFEKGIRDGKTVFFIDPAIFIGDGEKVKRLLFGAPEAKQLKAML